MKISTAIAVAGTTQVAISFGLARYADGMYLPESGSTCGLPLATLAAIAGASYVVYMAGVVASGVGSARSNPRLAMYIAGVAGVAGLALAASVGNGWMLAAGVVLAGSSAGGGCAPRTPGGLLQGTASFFPSRHGDLRPNGVRCRWSTTQ